MSPDEQLLYRNYQLPIKRFSDLYFKLLPKSIWGAADLERAMQKQMLDRFPSNVFSTVVHPFDPDVTRFYDAFKANAPFQEVLARVEGARQAALEYALTDDHDLNKNERALLSAITSNELLRHGGSIFEQALERLSMKTEAIILRKKAMELAERMAARIEEPGRQEEFAKHLKEIADKFFEASEELAAK
jgi:hypothetical protein